MLSILLQRIPHIIVQANEIEISCTYDATRGTPAPPGECGSDLRYNRFQH